MPDTAQRRLKLKVCGMRDPANLMELFDVQPDLIGLIFYAGSKRCIDRYSTAIKAVKWPSTVDRVGVFVNEIPENILEKVEEYRLEWVQLHGDEPPRMCGAMKDRGLNVIKALGINSQFDPALLKTYESVVDCFLFDTATRDYGGSGRAFDWAALDGFDSRVPFILSGGLDVGMERDILKLAAERPLWGIDINSRFELEPGLKDVARVKAFDDTLRKLEKEIYK